ncbi:MAG TPA: SsrA-binding protein SmpB [Candidatus Parcubacteria bacterium]|jgi:SsrA-binding protein|nr:SsrA-binding protein [Parcubacteria group bacterium]HJN62245.1 SsrA-binding protein SmpB [Candidatus Parcubacteria bacterium]|tara:strand:+ start:14695 stop:15144 length:450 start_codon:yes stop_codon:yes gene_type:complete
MKPLAENKKAYFNYEILEKLEAGLVLIGQEVKSIKLGRINLAGSYVVLKGNEFFLVGSNVPPYQPKNALPDYEPQRPRKLLLKKAEIKYLIGKSSQKSLTLVPLKVYTKRGKIKIEFAIVRGKRKSDKRERIKKRESDREIRRAMKEKF